MPLLNLPGSASARDADRLQQAQLHGALESMPAARSAPAWDPALQMPSRDLLRPGAAQDVICGNATCDGRWTPPWRSRKHPVFEGRWTCSSRCLLAMTRSAIAREIGDGQRTTPLGPHQHRIPLGLVMLSQGWITHPQLRQALDSQRSRGSGRIGDLLVSECGLRSEWVTRGLSVQWSCPVLTTDNFSPEMMALAMPRIFIEEFGILPLRVAASRIIYAGFKDHIDASSAFALEQISGLRTECGVIEDEQFLRAREQILRCRFADLTHSAATDRDTLARSMVQLIEHTKPVFARLVRLHRYFWLRMWPESEGAGSRTSPALATDAIFTIGP